MQPIELYPRFAAFARWLSLRSGTETPSWPALTDWLEGGEPLAVAVGSPRIARTESTVRWLASLAGWQVLFVPIEAAWGTALERQYLPALYEILADQAGEAPQRIVHPTALRDRVAELMEFVEVKAPGCTLLVLDGLDSALDGDARGWIQAFIQGARTHRDGAPLRLLVAVEDDAALAEATGDAPVITLDLPRSEDRTTDQRAADDARRALLSASADVWHAWQSAPSLRPAPHLLAYVRPALVQMWRAGSAEGVDAAALLSLADPAWRACWRQQEADGTTGFLADVCAIRQTVATTLSAIDELHCALVEVSVLDAITREQKGRSLSQGDEVERARALIALAAEAGNARETLLSWARTELGDSSDEEALAELADAAAGVRREPSELHTTRALIAELSAQPPAERTARADEAIEQAERLPDNLAIGTITALARYASEAKRTQSLSDLAARYLALPPSHTEIGFDLARRPMGMRRELARQVFSRILDYLLHGKLPFRSAWFFCSTEGDLRMLAPLLHVLEGDEGLLTAGRHILAVARAFP